MKNTQLRGFKDAELITKKFAKTFYFASRFLGREKRYAAYSVYALCRISDEAVDSGNNPSAADMLAGLQDNISAAYSDTKLKDNILLAFRSTVSGYGIPKEHFDELISGMRMDLEKNRYANFSELCEYCHKVAGVVGLIMLKIFGYRRTEAEKHATGLGIAMQLTNILRDIKEDFSRGRIYLPEDELRRFGVSEDEIVEEKISVNFKALLRFQIERARQYYCNSAGGIKMITDLRSRFVAAIMKDMYAGILDSIEKNKYDIYSRRACVSAAGKAGIAFKAALKGDYL